MLYISDYLVGKKAVFVLGSLFLVLGSWLYIFIHIYLKFDFNEKSTPFNLTVQYFILAGYQL